MRIHISAIVACIAFIISFLMGIVGPAGFPAVLTRALLFAATFFALILAVQLVGRKFLPDLLSAWTDEDALPGSQVDISVEDDENREEQAEDTEYSSATEENEEPLDKNTEINYTETADVDRKNEENEEKIFTPIMPGAGMFTVKDEEVPDVDTFDEQKESNSASKGQPRKMDEKTLAALGKQIDPAKMAGAIRTVLKRE